MIYVGHCPHCSKDVNQVTCFEDIFELALSKKSVIIPNSMCWNKPTPAAFMQNQQAIRLRTLIGMGMFVYIPKESK